MLSTTRCRLPGSHLPGWQQQKGFAEMKCIKDISDIDWNRVIEIKRGQTGKKKDSGSQYWDRRAPSFVNHTRKSLYANTFIEILAPRPSWSILDMGCGGGTLALPLSHRVKEITAVDYSDRMLEMLSAQIQRRKIKNINAIKASWTDDWTAKGIDSCDIAIASRSLSVDDMEDAIAKLNNAARMGVYISTVVGDGPFDRGIFGVIGRELIQAVDYIYLYNLLYQMGIHANISFIKEETTRTFDDIEAAAQYFTWMLNEITPGEMRKLRRYIRNNMAMKSGKKLFEYKRGTKWAVIWWHKEGQV
jgi:SAM-dependent methyltransferase